MAGWGTRPKGSSRRVGKFHWKASSHPDPFHTSTGLPMPSALVCPATITACGCHFLITQCDSCLSLRHHPPFRTFTMTLRPRHDE